MFISERLLECSLSSTAIHLFLVLSKAGSGKNEVEILQKSIAKLVGVSNVTLMRATKELVNHSFIQVTKQGNKPILYIIKENK
jgi:transcription initiation factor TFIIIB Brf1 subunit/transcription initiation factor TFIIB